MCLSCDRKCLDLVEALIRLADAGHYQPVVELFKFPLQHCPDVLVFSLLQIVSFASTVFPQVLSSSRALMKLSLVLMRSNSTVSLCNDVFWSDCVKQVVWSRLKSELLQGVMPVFLGNHPNSAQVLTYAWHVGVSSLHCDGAVHTNHAIVLS